MDRSLGSHVGLFVASATPERNLSGSRPQTLPSRKALPEKVFLKISFILPKVKLVLSAGALFFYVKTLLLHPTAQKNLFFCLPQRDDIRGFVQVAFLPHTRYISHILTTYLPKGRIKNPLDWWK